MGRNFTGPAQYPTAQLPCKCYGAMRGWSNTAVVPDRTAVQVIKRKCCPNLKPVFLDKEKNNTKTTEKFNEKALSNSH
jgi:hypothetical protein